MYTALGAQVELGGRAEVEGLRGLCDSLRQEVDDHSVAGVSMVPTP